MKEEAFRVVKPPWITKEHLPHEPWGEDPGKSYQALLERIGLVVDKGKEQGDDDKQPPKKKAKTGQSEPK